MVQEALPEVNDYAGTSIVNSYDPVNTVVAEMCGQNDITGYI